MSKVVAKSRAKARSATGKATAKLLPKTKRKKVRKPELPDPGSFLETIAVGRRVEKYGHGKTIFRQGDPANAVYYIRSGKVRITVVSQHGKEGVIAFLGTGDFFGEGCLSGQKFHIATAAATSETVIVKIEKLSMTQVLREDPDFAHLFTTFLLSRSVQVEADLIDHLFNSSEKRLARILLLLANIGNEGAMETVPKISQEVLAARVGTTRSRINFFMNKFRKLGFIEYNGTLKVYTSILNVIVHD